jgi:hypothetical protein
VLCQHGRWTATVVKEHSAGGNDRVKRRKTRRMGGRRGLHGHATINEHQRSHEQCLLRETYACGRLQLRRASFTISAIFSRRYSTLLNSV